MALISLKPALLTAVVALLSSNSHAFTSPMRRTAMASSATFAEKPFFMSEEEGSGADKEPKEEPKEEPTSIDKTQLTSARKEVVFDDKTGRFFETSLEAQDCIPEEEYCQIDDETGERIRLTLAEKERIFLDSLQSYYFSGRQVLPDEEFDALKEDLQWSGSEVVALNRDEAKYMSAVEAYMKGKPILSDSEFDALKLELKKSGSRFAVDREPKCYIDTGVCKVTLQEDKFRSNLLYLPAGSIISILWLGLGFEFIEPIIRLNPLILAALGSPLVYFGSKFITENFLFEDKFIVYGPCPSCETENRLYFGKILGVEGFSDVGEFKCTKCKTTVTVQRNTLRASTLPKA